MSNTKGRKLISLVLAALMAGSAFATAIGAAGTADGQTGASSQSSGMSLATISDVLSTISYYEYLARHKDAADAASAVKVDLSTTIAMQPRRRSSCWTATAARAARSSARATQERLHLI